MACNCSHVAAMTTQRGVGQSRHLMGLGTRKRAATPNIYSDARETNVSKVERFRYSAQFAGLLSDVVEVPLGEGRTLLVLSGVAAENPDGTPLQSNVPLAGDVEGQLGQVWERIGELLGKHGAVFADIIKITVYVTDARHVLHPSGDLLFEIFKGIDPPAATGVVVSGLAHPELLVEIDVMAVVEA